MSVTVECALCGHVYPQGLSDDALTRLIDAHLRLKHQMSTWSGMLPKDKKHG